MWIYEESLDLIDDLEGFVINSGRFFIWVK
jgi:hypothetical protein